MHNRSRRVLRKVHPVIRHGGTDDPLKLVTNVELGNAEWMLESMVHEFAGLGYDADELTNLFRCPAYPALNELLDYFGPAEIRRRIDFLLTRSGAQDIGPKGMRARGTKTIQVPKLFRRDQTQHSAGDGPRWNSIWWRQAPSPTAGTVYATPPKARRL